MDSEMIKSLLEKYWKAETTVEEERELADCFKNSPGDPELEPFRTVFSYFEAESEIVPGEDLGNRIMESIRQGEAAEPHHAAASSGPTSPLPTRRPAPVRSIRGFKTGWAAAAVVILSLGIFLMTGPSKSEPAGSTFIDPTTAAQGASTAASAAGTEKDTYDDPQQALAAVRKALLAVSSKMNRGRSITRRNMDRLNNSWQSAMND